MHRDTIKAFTDAAAEAVAQCIAGIRHDAAQERALRQAERRAQDAEFQVRLSAVVDLERRLTERLASLRDGVDGRDGAPGERGAPGEPGSPGRDGVDGKDGAPGADGAPGRDGIDGKDGRDGVDGRDGANGRDGIDGVAGRDGERGPEGPVGRLPEARAWSDGVHYTGDVVTHAGASWQAQRDTGRAPPHDDWICIARAGQDGADGRSFTIRGTWAEAETYRALDVVALNGASFAARRDDPGPCPGDGWQMIARQGQQGKPGEGRSGLPGERGPPGPAVVDMALDDDALLTLTNADGSTVQADFYPLLSRIAR